MKNFFKKLSFVLAIAMVLTTIAPATASAKEVVPAKKVTTKVNGEKVTSIELDVEETETVKIGLPVKKAYEGQKSTYKTWAVSADETVAEVAKVGNKTYDVTGVAAGETTITINAAKTLKLAKAGKGVETTLTVVVNAPAVELTAAQAGAAKIKVTGADLTDKVTDYVVKRGATTVSIKSVALNEDKTEAVLTSSASKLIKGDYTVSVQKSDAVEFTVEDAYVAEIAILSDVAALKTGSTTEAAVVFVAFNQFEENVTATTLANAGTLTVSGAARVDYDTTNKIATATFESANPYTVGYSVVALTIVCNANGTNTSKTLTIAQEATMSSVEFIGMYAVVDRVVVKEATLKEKMDAADIAATGAHLLFSAKDQYGNANYDVADLNVIVSGISGLNKGTVTVVRDAYYNYYIAYPVEILDTYEALYAGTNNVMAVVKNNGHNVAGTVDVATVSKIDSIAILTSDVYDNKDNALEYEILDTEGNLVTSYTALKEIEDVLPAGVRLVRKTDGTGVLVYHPARDTEIDVPVVLSFQSETFKFSSVTMTLHPTCVPTTLVVAPTAALGAINGDTIDLYAWDFQVLDQYGNNYVATGLRINGVESVNSTNAAAVNGVTGGVIPASTDDAYYLPVVTISTAAGQTGTTEIVLSINGYEDTDCAVNALVTEIEKVSNFAVKDMNLLHSNTTGTAIKVTGTVGTTTVEIPTSYYTVITKTNDGTTIDTPAIDFDKEGFTTKSMTFDVVINNKAGSQISKTVEYSNIYDMAKVVELDPYAEITAASVDYADLMALIDVKDQYGEWNSYYDTVRIQVSNLANPYAVVSYNNTDAVEVTGLIADEVIHVVYTFSFGLVFEADIPVYY